MAKNDVETPRLIADGPHPPPAIGNAPPAEETEERASRGGTDPELLTAGRILRLLGELEDDAARFRVIEYLRSRFLARSYGGGS